MAMQLQMEIRKINRRRPRSVEDAEFGHFTPYCFAEDSKEMYKDL